ncbi:MAG TPA: phenylalanine--tRNA ligase subunit alpha [Actinomycetota bacterium]|nr:phenylalanine--tRNA ligase subunit alpha [Actinomycetota bacterium]
MAEPTAEEFLRTLERELERGRSVLAAASNLQSLEEAEVALLGRKSSFSAVQRALGTLPEDDRRRVGQRTNEVREALRSAVAARRAELEAAREGQLLDADRIDVTLPGRRLRTGSMHPLSLTEGRIVDIFTRMGYVTVEGPEVETDWYNFTALNIPPDHPARTERDTLYVEVPGQQDLLMRTETSAMQIRTMERQRPPVYVIAPGRVFRQETPDPTHTPVFHQVEGLAVDEGITMGDLRGTLASFARAMFGPKTRVRFIPDFFPFVEPGVELAVSCFLCGGTGCRTCKFEGWIELLGAGMVHPNVLRNVGYDPERYTGFAFGMGIERVAMVMFGVPDIRMFYENDVRFLQQFEGVG